MYKHFDPWRRVACGMQLTCAHYAFDKFSMKRGRRPGNVGQGASDLITQPPVGRETEREREMLSKQTMQRLPEQRQGLLPPPLSAFHMLSSRIINQKSVT